MSLPASVKAFALGRIGGHEVQARRAARRRFRAAPPTAPARRWRDCRDSSRSRCDAARSSPARHRTSRASPSSASMVHGGVSGWPASTATGRQMISIHWLAALRALDDDADRDAGQRRAAHVTASRCLIGRPVTRFCGFRRSTLSCVHRQDQIDRLALAPCPSRRRDRGTSAGTARPRAPARPRRAPRRSTARRRSGCPRRRARRTRSSFASRTSVSGSTSTSTASRCATQRAITSPSACKPAPAGGEIERHVELVAVLEIVLGVVVVHHVDLGLGRNAEHRDERRHRRVALAGDRFLVGGDQRAFVQGHALRPEEQLGRAQHVGIVAVVERVAQDDVHELIDEQVRDLDAAADEVEIGRLERAVADRAGRGTPASPASSRARRRRRWRRSPAPRPAGAARRAARRAACARRRRPRAAARAPAAPDRP